MHWFNGALLQFASDVVETCLISVPFSNMRTPKLYSKTNAFYFFATTNKMVGGSSQLPTTAEHCFIAWTMLNDLITTHSTIVGCWEEPPKIWLTVVKDAFLIWALNFRVCVLMKGAENNQPFYLICSFEIHCLLFKLFKQHIYNLRHDQNNVQLYLEQKERSWKGLPNVFFYLVIHGNLST